MDVDEEQIEEIKECFSLFDKKGDMKVDHDRVIDVLRSLGLNPLSEDVDKCLETSDLMNKRVDFETFYGIHQQLSKASVPVLYHDMVEGLRTMDREQTGMVSAAELRHVLMNVADKMTEEQVSDITQPHEDANGAVNYDQLIKTIMSG
eukprot:gene5495-6180_t